MTKLQVLLEPRDAASVAALAERMQVSDSAAARAVLRAGLRAVEHDPAALLGPAPAKETA